MLSNLPAKLIGSPSPAKTAYTVAWISSPIVWLADLKAPTTMANKIIGKVSQFDLDWDSGLAFNCCLDEITNNDQDAFEGMRIQCPECGQEFVLEPHPSTKKLMWRVKQ